MSSSLIWTVVLMALLLPLSEMASASSQVLGQNNNGNNRVFIFQIPLQQLDPKISPRIPDSSTTTEDSYLVALRESQINRNKVPVAAVAQHHHHHEKGHHHVDSHHHDLDANKQLKGHQHQHHSTEVPVSTYEYLTTRRPLTAMEKNYLRPQHRPQLYKKNTAPHSHTGELNQQAEEAPADEETSEEVMETSASNIKVATLTNTRPFSSVSDVNSVYSTYSSNAARVVTNKPSSIKTTTLKASESGSEKPQEKYGKPIKKTLQIRVPEMVGVMTNRAANVIRNGMKTVGTTIGIPVRNSWVGKVNSLFPALSVGRKKRSIPEEFQEAKGWKDEIHKSSTRTLGYMELLAKLMNRPLQSAAANLNKFPNAGKRPLWLQFTRSANRPGDCIRNGVTNKAHSVVKRSTNLKKIKNFRATAFKRVILPWIHSAFSRNKNRRKEQSQVRHVGITNDEANFMEENEVDVERFMYSPSPQQTSEYQSGENETNMEENVEVNALLGIKDKTNSTLMSELKGDQLETVNKYTHGHGIIVIPPGEVSDSDETNKNTYGAVIPPSDNEIDAHNNDEDDVSKYTHGHGIIVANPLQDSNPTVESSNIDSNIENNNQSSVASPDDPYIAITGIFGDEVDSELDDLGSLMTDIVIAPLPVEAVVAEESVTEPFDAVIIESAGSTTGSPIASNLANIFIAASSASGSSQTSSSSSSGSTSSAAGIIGSTISAVSTDPFASLYTFGLAAIGIFVLSLPIWVPIVASRMKRRRNKLIRNRSPSSDFSSPSLYANIMEFNPYSVLMRNLMPSDSEEPFSDPGPLKSEGIYGPATYDRRWRRR